MEERRHWLRPTPRRAAELGIPVPDALAIAGFDDSELAQYVWPTLTTGAQPIRRVADLAAELDLRCLPARGSSTCSRLLPHPNGERLGQASYRLEARIVERAST